MSHGGFVVKYLTVIKNFQCLTYLSPSGVCYFKYVTEFLSVSMHNIFIPFWGMLSVLVTERNSVTIHNILIPLWGMLFVFINRDMNKLINYVTKTEF